MPLVTFYGYDNIAFSSPTSLIHSSSILPVHADYIKRMTTPLLWQPDQYMARPSLRGGGRLQLLVDGAEWYKGSVTELEEVAVVGENVE